MNTQTENLGLKDWELDVVDGVLFIDYFRRRYGRPGAQIGQWMLEQAIDRDVEIIQDRINRNYEQHGMDCRGMAGTK